MSTSFPMQVIDGRNKSPGFSAQYCTYTVMEHNTLEILACAIVDKRQI